jgi:hypothetical protein
MGKKIVAPAIHPLLPSVDHERTDKIVGYRLRCCVATRSEKWCSFRPRHKSGNAYDVPCPPPHTPQVPRFRRTGPTECWARWAQRGLSINKIESESYIIPHESACMSFDFAVGLRMAYLRI